MGKSKIEWCEETVNFITGCTKCSPGCDNCYAERMSKRLKAMGKFDYNNVVDKKGWTGKVCFKDVKLPKKPSLIFVNSMSDTFHKKVPFEWIDSIFAIIEENPQHKFIVLTKRIERVLEWHNYAEFENTDGTGNLETSNWEWPTNLLLGVTVCNQEEADKKIPILFDIPAKWRFISIEPMLGTIDLKEYLPEFCETCGNIGEVMEMKCYGGMPTEVRLPCPDCDIDMYDGIDWVIVGGESGPGARPMDPDWVRSIRDQCLRTGTPFLFKQWGNWAPSECVEDPIKKYKTCYFDGDEWIECSDDWATEEDYGPLMYKVGKKNGGRFLDGKIHNDYPKL